MSIFAKPLSHITTEDLEELVSEEAVENVRLEFKSDVPAKDETLKKLSSFANVFGGYLVVGAKERSREDRRIGSLPGVEIQSGYKQRIVQWCFEGVYPPLVAEVSEPVPVPHAAGGGRVCYVIYTPGSEVGPHFLHGRKGVYVRTDEFSGRFEPQLATEGELRSLLNRREVIVNRRKVLVDRARERFRIFREKPRDDGKSISAYMELSVGPCFPTRTLCDHDFLLKCLPQELIGYRGTAFPNPNQMISQYESAIVLNPFQDASLLEVNVWGMLLYATEIDRNAMGEAGVHAGRFIGRLLILARHAAKILAKVNYLGTLRLELALKSIRGVSWLHSHYGVLMPASASELDDDVSIPLEVDSAAFIANPDEAALNLLRSTFYAINWPSAVSTDDRLRSLLQVGHQFNSWA